MKLLLDANLSWRLTELLKPYFLEIVHVDRSGLTFPAKDIEIWEYAKNHGYIIVTNDSDFRNLATQFGFPPKVVLLKMGNHSTKQIKKAIIQNREKIEQLSKTEEIGILIVISNE